MGLIKKCAWHARVLWVKVRALFATTKFEMQMLRFEMQSLLLRRP